MSLKLSSQRLVLQQSIPVKAAEAILDDKNMVKT